MSSVKGETRIEEPSAAERAVARRTAEARATVPQVEMSIEVGVAAAPGTARLVHACAGALRAVPRANAAYRDGRFELYSRINVGLVVAADEAYVIPTVFDADQKPAEELRDEIEQLTRGARERRLAPPAFSGATFTVWDAGALGLTSAAPVINPPQAAALAAGAVRTVAGMGLMTVTLACDHRILYGAEAARFLGEVGSRLQDR